MQADEARRRFADSRVARLATVRPDGQPHLVPIVYAVVDDLVVSRIDHKPKRTNEVQRLVNLRRQPLCTLLADRYDEDWSQLWWVRADGRATVVDHPSPGHPGFTELVERYVPYRRQPPQGPLIAIRIERWTGWSADEPT